MRIRMIIFEFQFKSSSIFSSFRIVLAVLLNFMNNPDMKHQQISHTALVFTIFFSLASYASAQGTLEDYRQAEKFLPKNIEKLVFNMSVSPHWMDKDGSRFWYMNRARHGKEFMLVDPKKGTILPLFDHGRLAEALAKAAEIDVKAESLPFNTLILKKEENAVRFKVGKNDWKCDLKTYTCEKIKPEKPIDPSEVLSPDKKWVAFVKNFNLYVRSVETGEEFPLSRDGVNKYDYATTLSWYKLFNESDPEKNKKEKPQIHIRWSPDSRKIATQRLDRRKAKKLYLYRSKPQKGYRAEVYSYERALPGETDLTMIEYVLFDVEQKDLKTIDIKPYPAFLGSGIPQWSKDSKRLYMTYWHRGYQKADLLEIQAATGKTHIILTETSKTNVDMGMMDMVLVRDGAAILWTSERDGWNHIYLVDGRTGRVKFRVTQGDFVVRSIDRVDEPNRVVYFTASGREKGQDPYFRHLYRVGFDGSNLTLLTPENAEHEISFSPDGKFFLDNFSRVDLPPKSILREGATGKILQTIQEADIQDLLQTGWTFPEPFTVKARDGQTDIYGVIFRPSHFDPGKKYPVIDATYSGPQAVRTPKSFYKGFRNSDQPIAELGFMVITVDGLGTAMRSKKFHDFSYKNLGDIGAEDHITAIKQLTERFPYMEISKVGIYGHSAGGYDAAHALLVQPEFYKVAVSSAGNHDHRMAKVWWPEFWMGFPVGKHYAEQSNLTLAKNLKGKLLLVHGDMDNNVNPASTLRFTAELIKANKDFNLIIIPNRKHGLGDHPYFIRKRWDYFVQHLLGVSPPKEYKISYKIGDGSI